VAGGAFGVDAFIGVELGGDGREDALLAGVVHAGLLESDEGEGLDSGYVANILRSLKKHISVNH
jgi:hypothetical protein